MKEKLTKLMSFYKELGELEKKYAELYVEVATNFDKIDEKKYEEYSFLYDKEETLKEAIDFCLDEVTESERKWIAENNKDDAGFFISLFTKECEFDKEKMLKLKDYDNYGIMELANLNQEIVSKLDIIQEEESSIKKEVKENPSYKKLKENTEKLVSTANNIVTPYAEVAKGQLDAAIDFADKKYQEVKNNVDKKISDGAKCLSKKLEDISNKYNK